MVDKVQSHGERDEKRCPQPNRQRSQPPRGHTPRTFSPAVLGQEENCNQEGCNAKGNVAVEPQPIQDPAKNSQEPCRGRAPSRVFIAPCEQKQIQRGGQKEGHENGAKTHAGNPQWPEAGGKKPDAEQRNAFQEKLPGEEIDEEDGERSNQRRAKAQPDGVGSQECFSHTRQIDPQPFAPGTYRIENPEVARVHGFETLATVDDFVPIYAGGNAPERVETQASS